MADIVGERLKRIRENKRLSLRALAAMAQVPLSTLSAVESGKRPGDGLTIATARRLAIALGVTLDHLAFVYEQEQAQVEATKPRNGRRKRTRKTDGEDALVA